MTTTLERRSAGAGLLGRPDDVVPPDDTVRDSYLDGRGRWLPLVQVLAFAGVGVSLYGFARMSYWTLVFAVPLALFAVEMLVALRTAGRRPRLDLATHRRRVESWLPARLPTVDVYLPTAGEDLAVLRNTYGFVAELAWNDTLRVYVLDDGDRAEVEDLAREFGYRYLTRDGREFKKAGNLDHALGRTDGEFIVILDADFVPRPDFLHELVPYFDDPTVGIVQSPQHFRTDSTMPWLQRTAGATQELFYRFIQPSRDRVGAAICVGTSAIYRRAALDAIGGFPKISHSEDVVTGLEMARAGYSLRYVATVVSTGACPTELGSFVAQQYRWCEGSLALLTDPRFHLDPTMTRSQRLSYWSGFLYYLTTALNAVMAPLPAIVMVWFLPGAVHASSLLPLVGSLLLWLVVYPLVFHGRWRLDVLRTQFVYSVAHALAIVDAVRVRPVEWVPTGASQSSVVGTTVRRVCTWFLATSQVLLIVGLVVQTARHGLDEYWSMIAFAAVNAYVFWPIVWLGLRSGPERGAHRSRSRSTPLLGRPAQ